MSWMMDGMGDMDKDILGVFWFSMISRLLDETMRCTFRLIAEELLNLNLFDMPFTESVLEIWNPTISPGCTKQCMVRL